MSCSNQIICYTSPHLSLHVPFFFLLVILTHCYVIVNGFYYPPLQAYLQYKKSFHYISNPSCVELITALCSLSNSNIVISFLIMLVGTLLYKFRFVNLSYYSTYNPLHNKKEQPNYLDHSLFITSMIIIS